MHELISVEKLAGFNVEAGQNDRLCCWARFYVLSIIYPYWLPQQARARVGYPKKLIPTADFTCVSSYLLKNWQGSMGQLIKMTDFVVGLDSMFFP